MNWQMILAGFGGQGMLFLGQLLAYGAMEEGKNTTWMPSYGPEMRGGTANCTVVISNKPVSSPIVGRPNLLVAMNLPSLAKFENTVQKDGFLFVNSSLINKEVNRDDINVIKIPANEIAEQLGSPKAANMVILGAILGKTKCLELETIYQFLEKKNPRKEIFESNIKAIEKGMEFALNN
ncbi:MAG: 2-oxoacid:acceptor oxidoreductase family protein [Peptococcales bacterium]|jgi:2-oxoglutarate ferredoxin oxidoreductase subunit gamma